MAKAPATKKASAKKKSAASALSDLDFLASLASEPDDPLKDKDVTKMLEYLVKGLEQGKPELVDAVGEATDRICNLEGGFNKMMKVGGIETFLRCLQSKPKGEVGRATKDAADALYQGAVRWLDAVDPIDFQEIGNVLHVSNWLGCRDQDVAVSALDALGRFGLHRIDNSLALLQGGVMKIIHQILGSHVTPELLQEAMMMLYRLSDLPEGQSAQYIIKERGVVQTVVELVNQAPLNMRLQFTAVRLFSLWWSLRVPEESQKGVSMEARAAAQCADDTVDLRKILAEANPKAVLDRVVGDLERAGFTHMTAWAATLGTRALQKAVPRPNRRRRRSEEDEGDGN